MPKAAAVRAGGGHAGTHTHTHAHQCLARLQKLNCLEIADDATTARGWRGNRRALAMMRRKRASLPARVVWKSGTVECASRARALLLLRIRMIVGVK